MPSQRSSTARLRQALRYATYDWTREMSGTTRLLAWAGILLQGYALYTTGTGTIESRVYTKQFSRGREE